MARKKSSKRTATPAKSKDSGDSKVFAFLAVLLSIIGFVIAILAKRQDKYVMYYAKQSLIIFIAAIILNVLTWILAFIPIIGWIAIVVLTLGMVILWVIALINSLSGMEKETPIIGKYAKGIKL